MSCYIQHQYSYIQGTYSNKQRNNDKQKNSDKQNYPQAIF